MDIYRVEIHGNIVEARRGDFAGESAFLNGREVAARPFAGLGIGKPLQFDMQDETGVTRRVEIRLEDKSFSLGIKYQFRVFIDGVDRAIMVPYKPTKPQCCANCGYSLKGLTPQNGEVRCPECGRHTSAAMLGIKDDKATP